MSARKRRPEPTSPAQQPLPQPSHEEIERRAYLIFQERGAEAGHDIEHWLQAEQELRGRPGTRPAPRSTS